MVRLRVNRRDVTAEWIALLAAPSSPSSRGAGRSRRQRPRTSLLNEAPRVVLDGSRTDSLRTDPRSAAQDQLALGPAQFALSGSLWDTFRRGRR
jgi:hypothetical protein